MCERCCLPARPGLSRRGLLGAMSVSVIASGLAAPGLAAGDEPPPAGIGGEAALQRLLDGNARYATSKVQCRDFGEGRAARVLGQRPIAAILSCADSRVPPEFVFDQGSGDVIRVAGNVLSEEGLASLEYGSKVLGIPLILVLGHSKCGAVEAAIKVIKDHATLPGHLPQLIDQIKPAVLAAEAASPADLLSAAIAGNVRQTVEHIATAKPVLSALVAAGEVKVAGATYELETGQVRLV